MSVHSLDLLTAEEIDTLLSINAAILATQRLSAGAKVRFGLTVPDSVRAKLTNAFGFPVTNPVPAQLVRGETGRHVDVGEDAFENTHLVYLTDSAGALEIDGTLFPIAAGRGYVFGQGLTHGTVGAEGERLSLGPFNEHEKFVGCYGYFIYKTGYTPGTYEFGDCICPSPTPPTLSVVSYDSLAGSVVPPGYVFVGWSTQNPPTTVDYTVGSTFFCGLNVNLYPVFAPANPCPPISDPYKMPESLHTEVKKSKVLIQSEPATPIQKYSQTYAYSRAEQIKARVLAAKCCGRCS